MPMQDRHLRWSPTFSLDPKWLSTFEILESPLNLNVLHTCALMTLRRQIYVECVWIFKHR